MRARDSEAGKANIELLVGWGMREQSCVGCKNLCEYIMLGAGRGRGHHLKAVVRGVTAGLYVSNFYSRFADARCRQW